MYLNRFLPYDFNNFLKIKSENKSRYFVPNCVFQFFTGNFNR